MADGKVIIETDLDESGVKKGLNKLGNTLKTGLQKAAKIGVAAITSVSIALGSAGTAAVNVGKSFEQGMSNVSAISGATGDDLAALTEKAKEMGIKTKFSASEATDALNYMAMAGWKTEQMIGGIEGVMNLAAASGEDLASVSDIVTDALTAFNMKAEESGRFADVLAAASSNANTNVGMMGYSFKYVAPIAGAMGYACEDVAVAIGLMANAGIKGEMAGTQLRATITRLVKPTKDSETAMNKLGISVTKSDGTMKSLNEIILDLRKGFSKLTKDEQAQYAAMLAGQEAMSGLLSIVNASDADFDKLTESINNSSGAAERMAEIKLDNLQGDIDILKSSTEGLGIQIYESMQKPLRSVTKTGIEMVNTLSTAFSNGGFSGMVSEAGNLFASLATKAAEQAPKMIDAAVNFILSFVEGIKNNKGKLMQAAKDIVQALANGLVKLLPESIQAPVKDTIKIITKSFNNGGLRKAINTVGRIMTNLGKVFTNVAKVVLPPLAKAVDFLAGNLDKVIPLAAAFFGAFKAYQILSSVANIVKGATAAITACGAAESATALATNLSTGAITLKQAAVGVLTGKIGFATAAQTLWNAVMSANPIGLVVIAVAALASGIAALIITQNDSKKAFETMGTAATNFYNGIDTAKSRLDEFDNTLFASNEKQQELATNMQEVQNGITEICQRAADERRGYTEQEIQQLDQYFEKLNALTEEQFRIGREKGIAITQMAQTESETFQGSLEEYQALSQEWIKTAQEHANEQKSVIEEQTTNEIALLNQKFGDRARISDEEYAAEYKKLIEQKERRLKIVNEEVGKVSAIYTEGYRQRSQLDDNYAQSAIAANRKIEDEKRQHAEKIKELEETYRNDQFRREKAIESESNNHKNNIKKIWEELTAGLSEEQYNQMGVLIAMASNTELYGGQITGATGGIAESVIQAFDSMPNKTKDAMKNAIRPMFDQMKEAEPKLYNASYGLGKTVLRGFKDAFEIQSPSKATKKLFGFVVKGAEVGVDKEAPNLLDQTDKLAENVTESLSQAHAPTDLLKRIRALGAEKVNGFVNQMRAVVQSQQAQMATYAQAGVAGNILKSNPIVVNATPNIKLEGEAKTVLMLDKKEMGIALTPIISKELGWKK